MTDPIKPTTQTDKPNLSTEHQRDGDARRPSDTLDKGQGDRGQGDRGQGRADGETVPRQSSLTGDR